VDCTAIAPQSLSLDADLIAQSGAILSNSSPVLQNVDVLECHRYSFDVAWELEFTAEVEDWLLSLDSKTEFPKIAASIDQLEQEGPSLGRPTVDHIKGSKHQNMKELRSSGGHMRVLFAFDPKRQAVLLIGGDKTDQWNTWYRDNIPIADPPYDEHLEALQASSKVKRKE
jgi:hypothetical protein